MLIAHKIIFSVLFFFFFFRIHPLLTSVTLNFFSSLLFFAMIFCETFSPQSVRAKENQHLPMVSWKWFWCLLTNVRMYVMPCCYHTHGEIYLVYQIFTKIGDDKLITCNCDEKNCTVSIHCCYRRIVAAAGHM